MSKFGEDSNAGRSTTARNAAATSEDGLAILRIKNISLYFDVSPPWYQRVLQPGGRTWLHAVDGINLEIPRGKTFSLVGESGCGKTTLARLVAGLYEPTEGTIEFDGSIISETGRSAMDAHVRRRIQMIFQDPYASLNPRWRVGRIIAEPLVVHEPDMTKAQRLSRVGELLSQVGLEAEVARKFPHQFSGGQRQRISIARALATNPDLLVCDEPTSALDVSVQAQILNLMRGLQEKLGLTYLFISHDLAVVRFVSDYIGVMYLGRIVEWNLADELFERPSHPYTRKLLDSIPDLENPDRGREPIAGEVASPISPPAGCHFHPRCPLANDRCRKDSPLMMTNSNGGIRCHAFEEGRV